MLLLRNKTASGFLCEIVVVKCIVRQAKIIADLKSKESKLKVCLNMPGKYTSDEEKACFLAWKQEKMPIKIIYEQSGKGKATIMRLLAVAKELPNNIVSKHKFGGGRRRKTS